MIIKEMAKLNLIYGSFIYTELTSTNTEEQIMMMQTTKKIFNAVGGGVGKTNELMTVTWKSKERGF